MVLARVGDSLDQTGEYHEAFFVIVDPDATTYATFRAAFEKPSLMVPPSTMVDYLKRIGRAEELGSLELEAEAGGPGSRPDPEPMCEETCFCSGTFNARIRTYDPANIYLTDTRVLYSFLHSGRQPPCRFFSWGNTTCWADPNSELFTTWYTTGCAASEDYPIIYSGWGQYINWDFLNDNKATHVDQGAQMNEWGTIWWWHSDWGEGSGLIYGAADLWGSSSC